MEWGAEKKPVYFKRKYLWIGELGSRILGKEENKKHCHTKWGNALENVPRAQANDAPSLSLKNSFLASETKRMSKKKKFD